MSWKQFVCNEAVFEFTRASGPGGQHVNRTETAVILRWSLVKSKAFTDVQKSLLFQKLGGSLTGEGEIVFKAGEFRDRLQNKDRAIEKLLQIITGALHVPKKRVKTKPTKSSKRKRLDSKSKHSAKKNLRRERFE